MQENRLNALQDIVLQTLRQYSPKPVTEIELIKILEKQQVSEFVEVDLTDTLALFQAHFLLFHTLYTLRQRGRSTQDYDLFINTLRIQLSAYNRTESSALTDFDALADYYLDISNLDTTSKGDVDTLLSRFWNGMGRQEKRQKALELLELKDPVNIKTIKKQYKKLAMQHHPDRGGDTEMLQKINEAMAILYENE